MMIMRNISLGFMVLAFALAGLEAQGEQTLVIRGAKLYPVAGPPIERGVLIVEAGKIKAVGAEGKIKIPPGAQVQEARGKVIIPGLVDTHSHLGLASRPRSPGGSDTNEGTGPLQPVLRAIDAIFPADPGIRMALAGGITTANIMPGSGNVMGGQTAYVKFRGTTIEEMLIPGALGGMKMANGENPKRSYGSRRAALPRHLPDRPARLPVGPSPSRFTLSRRAGPSTRS